MKLRVLVVSYAVLMFSIITALGETHFITSAGDIGDPANWDNGLPTLENVGYIIGTDAKWLNDSIASNLSSHIVVGNAGRLIDEHGSYTSGELNGGILDIQTGGSYERVNAEYSNAMRIRDGGTLRVSGGNARFSGLVAYTGNVTVDITGGTFWSAKLINFNNGESNSTINVSHATAEFGLEVAETRAIDEANTFFNIGEGGILKMYKLGYATRANDTNIIVTISADGILETTFFDKADAPKRPNRYINFESDADACWTSNDLVAEDFETLWNQGILRHHGLKAGDEGAGTFSDNFTVSGNTITVIPEPGTIGLLATFGIALLFIRRMV